MGHDRDLIGRSSVLLWGLCNSFPNIFPPCRSLSRGNFQSSIGFSWIFFLSDCSKPDNGPPNEQSLTQSLLSLAKTIWNAILTFGHSRFIAGLLPGVKVRVIFGCRLFRLVSRCQRGWSTATELGALPDGGSVANFSRMRDPCSEPGISGASCIQT